MSAPAETGREPARAEPAWVGEVLRFWLEETPPERRFKRDEALDREVRARFLPLHEQIAAAPPASHELTPRLALASVIVLDQFPRNMFRGSARAFASDGEARALAAAALEAGFDRALDAEGRLFLYLPFEHSEVPTDQDRSVALFETLGNAEWQRYAVAHRDIIRRFGRFPHRNAALGRLSTPEETAFLEEPGSSF